MALSMLSGSLRRPAGGEKEVLSEHAKSGVYWADGYNSPIASKTTCRVCDDQNVSMRKSTLLKFDNM
eukprot:1093348-Pleurochrysis_carterae.AAC.1